MSEWWNIPLRSRKALPCALPQGAGSLQFLRTREGGKFYWVSRHQGKSCLTPLGAVRVTAQGISGMTPDTARAAILEKLGLPTDSSPTTRKSEGGGTRDASTREILRLREAAEFLGVSRSTFWRLSTSGQLPSGKPVGKRAHVWSRKQLEAWVLTDSHCGTSEAARD